MKLAGNTVLITGGACGIGLALAKQWVLADSRVIVCGTRKDQLERARQEVPEITTIECDVSSEAGRLSLFSRITKKFTQFNVLINYAGMHHTPPPLTQTQNWDKYRLELASNLEAPIHLSILFIPHLLKQDTSAIINLSADLTRARLAAMPGYCATKAGLHAFTICMREQLKSTSLQVFEVVPSGHYDDADCADAMAEHVIHELGQVAPNFGYASV